MTKFFFQFKNPIFSPFHQFWGQKIRLSCTTSLGFLAPCQNSEKSDHPIPGKTPRQIAGGKEVDPISQDPSGYCWGSNKTAVDWHLKVKHVGYDVCLTKTCCITINMQKSAQFILHSFSRF